MMQASPMSAVELAAPSRSDEQHDARPLDRDQLFKDLTDWYYRDGNGMLLSRHARNIYLTAKANLVCAPDKFLPAKARAAVANDDAERDRLTIRQLSLLRTAMRGDIAIFTTPWGSALTDEDVLFLCACGVDVSRDPWRGSLPRQLSSQEQLDLERLEADTPDWLIDSIGAPPADDDRGRIENWRRLALTVHGIRRRLDDENRPRRAGSRLRPSDSRQTERPPFRGTEGCAMLPRTLLAATLAALALLAARLGADSSRSPPRFRPSSRASRPTARRPRRTRPTTARASATCCRRARAGATTPPSSARSSPRAQRCRTSTTSSSLYTDLIYATPGLADADIDSTSRTRASASSPTTSTAPTRPRDDVTIVRDKSFGVPHVYGHTRAARCSGSATRAPRTACSSWTCCATTATASSRRFAGGANVDTDREQWEVAPYTGGPRAARSTSCPSSTASRARTSATTRRRACDGVNAYIAKAKLDPTLMPVEYAAIGQPDGPDDLEGHRRPQRSRRSSARSFGNGGGDELEQVAACSMRSTQALRREARPAGLAGLPLRGRPRGAGDGAREEGLPVRADPEVAAGHGGDPRRGLAEVRLTQVGRPTRRAPRRELRTRRRQGAAALPDDGLQRAARRRRSSSATGHPLAVFGPQAGVLRAADPLEGRRRRTGPASTCAARTFPGIGPYVEIGRGRDYAWSATSAGQDIIDVYALDLCDPDGGSRRRSTRWATCYRGQCLPIEVLERTERWYADARRPDRRPARETLRV